MNERINKGEYPIFHIFIFNVQKLLQKRTNFLEIAHPQPAHHQFVPGLVSN